MNKKSCNHFKLPEIQTFLFIALKVLKALYMGDYMISIKTSELKQSITGQKQTGEAKGHLRCLSDKICIFAGRRKCGKVKTYFAFALNLVHNAVICIKVSQFHKTNSDE